MEHEDQLAGLKGINLNYAEGIILITDGSFVVMCISISMVTWKCIRLLLDALSEGEVFRAGRPDSFVFHLKEVFR